ncbi:MAG: nucleotidyltransferase domain-containing protein [Candidatus Heimdallarchaeota archaeon]|nr:nucleotidyltransferase domain-containing protein [Candidatus Heimdallarchaeota archaeon]
MSKIIEFGKERFKELKAYKKHLPPLKKACLELLPDAKLFLFGSVLRDELVALSDIDLLITTKRTFETQLERAEIISTIEEKAHLSLIHPFDIHLLSQEEFKTFLDITKVRLKQI